MNPRGPGAGATAKGGDPRVAQIHRLEHCRRCRKIFVARPGERLCPDCRRQQRREAGRRALVGGATGWRATGAFAIGSVGLAIVAGVVHPAWLGLAAWVGGAAAVVYVARQP